MVQGLELGDLQGPLPTQIVVWLHDLLKGTLTRIVKNGFTASLPRLLIYR